MIAMILAAGRGERLRPLTDSLPKALVEVQGQSLLEHHLQALNRAGYDTVVINLGWLGEQIAERIGSGARYGINVVYSPEDNNVLETGGGIQRALPLLGTEPFLVVNADVFTAMPLPPALLPEQSLAKLILVATPAYRAHGDFDLVDGRVRNAVEPELTFSGIAIYRPEFFAACTPGRFSVVPLLRAAADAGQLAGELYTGPWADAGTAARLAEIGRS